MSKAFAAIPGPSARVLKARHLSALGDMDLQQQASLRLAQKILSAQPEASMEDILAVFSEYGDVLAGTRAARLPRTRMQGPAAAPVH